jgi:hypothetical protein
MQRGCSGPAPAPLSAALQSSDVARAVVMPMLLASSHMLVHAILPRRGRRAYAYPTMVTTCGVIWRSQLGYPRS